MRVALPGPMPPTRSTRSDQSLKLPALRASVILPDRPGPMPLTDSSSARLAWLTSTAAKAFSAQTVASRVIS